MSQALVDPKQDAIVAKRLTQSRYFQGQHCPRRGSSYAALVLGRNNYRRPAWSRGGR